jgi:tRNA pseudouridine55 synthase
MPKRKVRIFSIDIVEYESPFLKIRTHVGSGTYIRTLAEDIGEVLGCGAYTTELRRTKIADYDIAKLPLFDLPQ